MSLDTKQLNDIETNGTDHLDCCQQELFRLGKFMLGFRVGCGIIMFGNVDYIRYIT